MAYAVYAEVQDAAGGSQRLSELVGEPANEQIYVEDVLEAASAKVDMMLGGAGYEVPVVVATHVADSVAQTRVTALLKRVCATLTLVMIRHTSVHAFNESTELAERSLMRMFADPAGLPIKRRDKTLEML